MSVFFILQIYKELLQKEVIVLKEEQLPPAVPMDYTWARVSLTTTFYFSNTSAPYMLWKNFAGIRFNTEIGIIYDIDM